MKKMLAIAALMLSGGVVHGADFGSLGLEISEMKAAAHSERGKEPEIKPFYAETGSRVDTIAVRGRSLSQYQGVIAWSNAGGTGSPAQDSAAQLPEIPGGTPYEKLKRLFACGAPVNRNELAGWKEGRAFRINGEVDVVGQVCMMAKVPEVTNGGPLFPPLKDKEFGCIFLAGMQNLDSGNNVAKIRELFDKGSRWVFYPEFPEARASVLSSDSGKSVVVEWRRAGGYIVERYEESDGLSREVVYSYYFKDVTP